MRLAVDGRAFVSPAGGVRRYVSELYAHLPPLASDLEIVAVGAPRSTRLPSGCVRMGEPPSPPTNLGRHMAGLPLRLASGGFDLYHAPAYVSPLWGRVPTVLSVHDISYETHPEWYPYRRDPLRRWFYRRSSEQARLILVPSRFTADEILRAYRVHPTRIRVIPLAAADEFFAPPTAPPPHRERILLHVGDLHPRRDLACAVGVLRRLVDGSRDADWRLVLIGRDRGSLADVRDVARAAGVGERLLHVVMATPAELFAWYSRAFALVYPSRYEGFGLPVAEAMAAGLPVVAARAGSVPEVVGDAGLLFEPGDDQAAARAIGHLAGDRAAYEERQAAGRAHVAQWRWSRTAAETLAAFREVARG